MKYLMPPVTEGFKIFSIALLLFLPACGGPGGKAVADRPLQQSAPETSPSAAPVEPPAPAQEPATPPPQSNADQIADYIKQADQKHKELLGIINIMFEDSLEQGKRIVCGSHRIHLLAGLPNLGPYTLDAFRTRVTALISDQFITITGNTSYPQYQRSIIIVIPPSKAYEENLGKRFTHEFRELHPTWYKQDCQPDFIVAIPNGKAAREEETQRFGQIVATARKRLQFYSDRLPTLELRASQALTVAAKLRIAQEDMKINSIAILNPSDATEHENLLNSAAQALSEWRRDSATDTRVSKNEVAAVINAILEDAPAAPYEQ